MNTTPTKFIYPLLIGVLLLTYIIFFWKNSPHLEIHYVDFGSHDEIYLNSGETTDLLKREKITKDELNYSIYKIEKPSSQIAFYSIKVEPISPNDADYRYREGMIVKASSSNSVLQAYAEHVTTDRMAEFGLDLPSSTVSFLDINKDGYNEFVLHADIGGNSIRSDIRKIYQLNNGEFKELKIDSLSSESCTLSNIVDIDNDGLYEAIVIDSDWEISSCTDHASGPIRYLVYSWDGTMYKDDSSKFPQFYEQYLNADISKVCNGKKEFCFGPALGKYFAFKQADKEKEGWNMFLRNTDGVANLMWPSKTCRNYLIDLHNKNEELKTPSLTTSELLNLE